MNGPVTDALVSSPQHEANVHRVQQDPVGVLVVDDQEVFRSVLRDVIAATPGMTLVGEAASGEQALEAVDALAPHLVVMDKRMPGMGGIDAARRIRVRHPEVVVLLASVEEPTPEALAASGAARVVPKQQLSPGVLVDVWRTRDA